ncbi:hypothetical protein [Paenibacillus apii]|uniref:hypothetical protein n=1 Tax=Paenibacillus apii TaxID=1850370 RepID=UPI00143AFC40|nr:hypothetical protein [Paenibacillus apii]NJJ38558.1 hypothetical protein [Paenibacillus apii]
MINWIKYDPENPPELKTEYLICTENNGIFAAALYEYESGQIVWAEAKDYEVILLVTHYAHINLPGEDTPE